MSLSGAFDTQAAATPPIKPKRAKREKPPSPFSLRLSAEERARLIGAECRIRSAAGEGTTVELRVPLA